jgi:hypothetical protein
VRAENREAAIDGWPANLITGSLDKLVDKDCLMHLQPAFLCGFFLRDDFFAAACRFRASTDPALR